MTMNDVTTLTAVGEGGVLFCTDVNGHAEDVPHECGSSSSRPNRVQAVTSCLRSLRR